MEAVTIVSEERNDFNNYKIIETHFAHTYTKELLDKFNMKEYVIDISKDPYEYLESLNELCSYYGGIDEPINYYTNDEGLLWFEESEIIKLQEVLDNGWRLHQIYSNWIADISAIYNFKNADEVHAFVKQWFNYAVTNENLMESVDNHIGQCWHQSVVMTDLCHASGVEANLVYNSQHSWVMSDGLRYD